jgi:hypothetical protein
MNYKSLLLNGIALIYKQLVSIQLPVVIVYGHGIYDLNNDVLAPGTQSPPINAFIYGGGETQNPSSVSNTQTVLFQVADLTAANVPPPVEQSCKLISNNLLWEIDFVGYDPIYGTLQCKCRRGS